MEKYENGYVRKQKQKLTHNTVGVSNRFCFMKFYFYITTADGEYNSEFDRKPLRRTTAAP